MRRSVLVCDADRYPSDVLELLSTKFTVLRSIARDQKSLKNEIIDNQVEVLFCNLSTKIDAQLLDGANSLRYVVSPTTGLSHVDLSYLKAKGISIVFLGHVKSEIASVFATAELAWALLLAVSRKVSLAARSTQLGEWHRENFFGLSLSNKVIGVVGFGRLGRQVANYALAFGMKVLAYDVDDEVFVNMKRDVNRSGLEDLLAKSDFVSVHVALTEQSKNLISRERVGQMKSGAVLINTSRGEIVDEDALVEAVKSGKLFGVGVDVLQSESDKNFEVMKSKLVEASNNGFNVLVTPHIGGWTGEAVYVTRLAITREFLNVYQKLDEHGKLIY